MAAQKLSAKHAAFVREYLKDFNATQAAKRAGYSKDTAYSQGQRLLKHVDVSAAIERGRKRVAERADIEVDEVIRGYINIARGNPKDIYSWDENGNVRLKPSDELSPEALAALDVRASTDKSGALGIDIRMRDSVAALNALGKHLGIDKNQVIEVRVQASVEDLIERVRPRMTDGAYAELITAIGAELGQQGLATSADDEGSES